MTASLLNAQMTAIAVRSLKKEKVMIIITSRIKQISQKASFEWDEKGKRSFICYNLSERINRKDM